MRIKFDMNRCVASQLGAAGLTYDAGETAAFSRELETIQAEAIEVKYPEYKYASLVPIKGDAMPGSTAHTWREVEGFGDAEWLESGAPEDFGTTEVQGKENTGKFRNLGTKYHYNLDEIERAALMSIKPQEHKAKMARRVVESRFDRAVFDGVPGVFTGLAEDAASQDDTALITGNWNTATPDNLKDSIQAMADKAFVTSNGVFESFDFVFSPKQWTKLGKRLDTYSDKTVADFILSSVPRVRSLSWSGRLAGKGTGGKDRILMFPRDPQVLEAYIPVAFRQLPPQFSGMVFTTYVIAKYGGLRVYHPNMIRRADTTIT